ncbi:phosphate ABC transporter substrate-binding protein [Pseudoalteromonas sp. CO325X]|uniref:phosphate ABC transporter substrate-binding protein n=1 Tax=Pseudoalteromonas sp. CO325X TaxID=1777262 RepID=UPI001023ED9E|nr:phosphate ABC transporter substrate-binding protein [Pseudoalteromonas sp. CO325X]RZF80573.1 phosphate ABC transporter substrate-binding protein [Pseudoalteromonas sp. CO325X]
MYKIAFFFTLLSSSVALADVAVIVHPSNGSDINKDTVERIFIGKEKSFSNGNKAIPISQASGATADEFNQKALNKSSGQLKAYWSKLVFTGKGTPPKEVDNDAEVIQLVSSNPDTIGFVDAGSVTDAVKVVTTF